MSLIDNAQAHIEEMVVSLKDDEDFLPFMALRRVEEGTVFVGLMMPDEPDRKDAVADTMMALCAIHRTTEVVFASTVWMVEGPKDMNVAPSQSPDRVEKAFLFHATLDGDAYHTASVLRSYGTVTLGGWEQYSATKTIGRFGDAIHIGMRMGRDIATNPTLCAYVDEKLAANEDEQLIRKFTSMANQVRAEAAANAAARN